MIKILCDSITDLPIEIIKKHNIDIVPLTVIFNEKEYLDRVDITTNEFYKMLRENDTMPKTSQATYAQFVKFFENIKMMKFCILQVHQLHLELTKVPYLQKEM